LAREVRIVPVTIEKDYLCYIFYHAIRLKLPLIIMGLLLVAVQEIQKTCEHLGSLSNPWCLMVFILVQRLDVSLELAHCDGMQTGPTHQKLLLCCYPCEFWLLSQELCLWHPEDKSRPILLTGFYGIIAGFARVKILVLKKLFFC
jgi:hypothetical protein